MHEGVFVRSGSAVLTDLGVPVKFREKFTGTDVSGLRAVAMKKHIGLLSELSRPFTLIFPFTASFAGVVLAAGRLDLKSAVLGAGAGGIFIISHSAANIFNQYYDRDIDAVNKPGRPIPRGDVPPAAALAVSLAAYAAGLGLSLLVNIRFFAFVSAYSALTIVYSAPPRLKRFPWLSNITIAAARGVLILVAGYAAVAPPGAEIWTIAGVLGIYLVGAASTKDFAEVEGDGRHGIRTLPVIYGAERTVKIIWPFFIFPFLLIPVGRHFSLVPAGMVPLAAFALPGAVTVYSMLRNPSGKAFTENSLCWGLMYLTLILYPITAMILELL